MPQSALLILSQKWIELTQKASSEMIKALSDVEVKD